MNNLLVELLVEELPPKALKTLGEAFAQTLTKNLQKADLCTETSVTTAYASPRRLAAHISQVRANAPEKTVRQKLMPVSVGLTPEGETTPALKKKLAALGAGDVAIATLQREQDGKTEALFLQSVRTGVSLAAGLQTALDAAISGLPIPKVMSYQLADGWTTVNFVRPVHGLLALFGADVVPVAALGLQAGNSTQGHRFQSAGALTIPHADQYAEVLSQQGSVIASFGERRAEIERQIAEQTALAQQDFAGRVQVIHDDDLLDEVTALVEWPRVMTGTFEEDFLQVPQECLILTMKANQKYFPLMSADNRLLNRFLLVSNINPDEQTAIIDGNERVVRPRLADARFFFEQDRKKTLAERVGNLDKVVYHNKLGSQGQRKTRVTNIAQKIAQAWLSAPQNNSKVAANDNAELCREVTLAAELAKADLLTDMVGEFPELQGIMGRYLALNDGLSEHVAFAIEDHYHPRFAGDELPRHTVGKIVALADKLETLAGLFGIGQTPSGDKDPFALRRHAIGVIRLLTEGGIDLPLSTLLDAANSAFAEVVGFSPAPTLRDFIDERFAGSLREQGFTAAEVDAVLSLRPEHLAQVPQRLAAVRAFLSLPEASALAAANKRVGNILKKATAADIGQNVDAARLIAPAEQALFAALQNAAPQADSAFAAGDYTRSLSALAQLREPVDNFFADVMVNVDDAAVKANRLALLVALSRAMNQVANLALLQ